MTEKRSETFATLTLGLATLVMLGLGCVGALRPALVLGPLGLDPSNASALNEMRARYGGVNLALAGWYAFGVWRPAFRAAALKLLAVHMAGLVTIRAVSLVIDGLPGEAVLKPWGGEVVLLVLSLVALVRRPAGE